MFPAMCGMDTLTTVVSRTSMKVASMTAMVTIQGLTWLGRVSGIETFFHSRIGADRRQVGDVAHRELNGEC